MILKTFFLPRKARNSRKIIRINNRLNVVIHLLSNTVNHSFILNFFVLFRGQLGLPA